jgi:alpha-beta hydrolase superfamily lysophospholipase
MLLEQTRVMAEDGLSIQIRHWCPEATDGRGLTHPIPRAVVQLSHGMAEHGGRYEYLARCLAGEGFATVASDHRGHGLNKGSRKGHYADEDGWQKVTGDLYSVRQYISTQYPGVPVFLLGHSMGSFISLGLLQRLQPVYQGVVLSGSDYTPPLKFKLALPVAKAERWFFGAGGRSPVMTFLSFGSFNRDFKPQRTPFDWLSSDNEQVDRYLQDPLCGFDCTNQLWVDLLGGLSEIYSPEGLARLQNLPYYLFAGEKDPVGQKGHGVMALAKALKKAGIRDIATRLYPEGRHEMLNEKIRDTVIDDLLAWLHQHLATT